MAWSNEAIASSYRPTPEQASFNQEAVGSSGWNWTARSKESFLVPAKSQHNTSINPSFMIIGLELKGFCQTKRSRLRKVSISLTSNPAEPGFVVSG